MQLHLRALDATFHNGIATIELPAVELAPEDQAVIERLLPDLQERLYELLNRQALLSSIATPAEVATSRNRVSHRAYKTPSPMPATTIDNGDDTPF